MKETILLYHIADQDRLHAIQRALLPLGMRIRMVQKEEYLQPVGFLADGKMVPISRSNRAKAKRAYEDFLFARTRGEK